MCGIAGVLRVRPAGGGSTTIEDRWLEILDAGIRRRGPDGKGVYRARATRTDGSVAEVALVHRRLSIIDLDGGAQPMVLRGSQPDVAVTFNGCIYNHRSLREELGGLGARFASDHSDTEVLLHAWREWRTGMFDRLDGMFAVALFDCATGELALTRDIMGEKPLYTLEVLPPEGGDFVAFASSPAPLLRLHANLAKQMRIPGPAVEPLWADEWIRFGFGGGTPFRDIKCVPPARAFLFGPPAIDRDDIRPSTRSVFCFGPQSLSQPGRGRLPTVDELDGALRLAVESRLESDVEVGCFLSGGIDSALVAAMLAKLGRKSPTFTVRMPDPRMDESAAAASTAAALGLPHHILDCEANPAADLHALVTGLMLPFGDTSILPAYWVSKAARGHVKVALGGDGGDELFMGYDRHRALRSLSILFELPGAPERAGARLVDIGSAGRRRSRLARLLGAAGTRRYSDLVAIFPYPFDEVLGLPPARSGTGLTIRELSEHARAFDLCRYLPDDLLRKGDTASMAVALELRAPLLARGVVDLAASAPARMLLAKGRKGLLKEVTRRYLPAEVVARPKRGFGVPIGAWLRQNTGGMRDLMNDVFDSQDPWPASLLGIEIRRAAAHRLRRAHLDGGQEHGQRLVMLTVLGIWCAALKRLLLDEL